MKEKINSTEVSRTRPTSTWGKHKTGEKSKDSVIMLDIECASTKSRFLKRKPLSREDRGFTRCLLVILLFSHCLMVVVDTRKGSAWPQTCPCPVPCFVGAPLEGFSAATKLWVQIASF